MDSKTGKDPLKDGLDRLEDVNVGELTDKDLDSVAGGMMEEEALMDCNSSWCCSNSGN